MMLLTDPLWTDVWQTIASLIGIPAAIVGFIILFIKDKNKENQIQKLSDIAENLSQMVADSEKRYIHTRKPLIDIKIKHLEDRKEIILEIFNSNQTSSLQFCKIEDLDRRYYDVIISDQTNSKQRFGFILHYENHPHEFQVLHIKYQTTEGYTFIQPLVLYFDDPKKPKVNQGIINYAEPPEN